MSIISPFQVMGKTYLIAANSVAQNVTINADSPSLQYSVTNATTGTVALVHISPGAAPVTAVIATPGAPNYGTPVLGGAVRVISGPQAANVANVTVSVILQSGAAANVFITPGEGMS